MNTEDGEDRPGLQEQIDALSDRVYRNHEQSDRSHEQSDRNHEQIGRNRADIDRLQAEGEADRALIARLQQDGVISQEHLAHIGQLEAALITSRKIGAAIGIIMAARRITDVEAFAVLADASQHANRKLRDVADDIVRTSDITDVPES